MNLGHKNQEDGREQPLIEHLNNTALLAKRFAEAFGAGDAAYRCGMLHDIGKYSEAFQKRIRGASIRVNHSTAGALEAYRLQDAAAAFAIAGHHGGLPDRGTMTSTEDGTLLARMKSRAGEEIEPYDNFREEVTIPRAEQPKALISCPTDAFFYEHMLYSCLVDADWLDTEHFMKNGTVERGTGAPIETLSQKLDDYVAAWWNSTKQLNIRRSKILRELINAGGQRKRGLYTLTVPTGGGKTVSSMAFALRHALKNSQNRIIYVIPYTSIIEQTQGEFEKIFGKENVVAHYANVTYPADENGAMSERDKRRYLASENWDAPIIITTAVQFFESLFGNHPSRCRKLHNIAGSVIIFDEAQMLPINYLRPCVWAITELVRCYRCSAVLCTATQPALEKIIREWLPSGTEELCSDIDGNHKFFRRVRYEKIGLLRDDELADRIKETERVLCVVNSRKQAQALYALLPEDGSFHLSTTMTAEHRRKTLKEIRRRLDERLPCRVISTSLIEAGVDISFPFVYRAVAGLDSMIQAAGRCNREGEPGTVQGVVYIFDTEAKPPRALTQNIAAAKRVIDQFDDLASPEAIEAYFSFLLYILKDQEALDEKHIMRLMADEMAFDAVAKNFHLIENHAVTVYIPLGGGEALVEKLRAEGPSRVLMRSLGQYAVSAYAYDYQKLDLAGAVEKISEDAAILINTEYYHEKIGLSLKAEAGNACFQ